MSLMVRLWTGGRGGVDTDVDDPDLLTGGGCGVGRRGRGRRRHTTPAALPLIRAPRAERDHRAHHPERMLHSRDERLYCIAFNYLCERAPQLPSR